MEENSMKDQTNNVLALLNKITDGGEITEDDVNDLRKHLLNEDGSYNVNREIADKLFELFNMAKNEQVVDNSFYRLFTDAICAHLLKDHSSTGVLDDREVDWLVGKIESNLEIDDKLFDLIQELKAKSYNHFPEKLDSAIFLLRLRRIQKMLSEPNNAGEGLFYKIVEKLNECVKERDKLYIDDKCILALFSIKDQLSRKKLLQLPDDRSGRTAQKTSESLTDQFINVFCELVSANVLYDANSPYIVDKSEANKLRDIINHKTSVDYIDKVLLDELESRSMYFPEVLAKVRFGYETAKIRFTVVNALLEKKYAKQATEALNEYLTKKFECRNEQEIKANLLFNLKNLTKRKDFKKVEGEETDIEYHIQEKYIDQVTKYITGAESQSPYEIDNEEKKWLEEKLTVSRSSYYQCDEKLLAQLKDSSVNYPHSLEEHLSKAIMTRILRELKDSNGTRDTDLIINELRGAIFDENDEFIIDAKEAAEFIFKIKDIIYQKDKKINKELSKFFVAVVSSYLLGDKKSPGKIDDAETEWLLAKINKNDETDKYDKALLKALEKKSINHPNVLHYTGWWKNAHRQILYFSRKMSWIAIWVSIIASFFLFIKGAAHVYYAGKSFIQCESVMVVDSTQLAVIKSETGLTGDTILVKKIFLKDKKLKHVRNIRVLADRNSLINGEKAILGVSDPDKCGAINSILQQDSIQLHGISDIKGNVGHRSALYLKIRSIKLDERKSLKGFESAKSEEIFGEIVEAIDSFLVAMVVFILGIGIFELFIRKMEKPYKVNEKRPSWMQMNSIDDLKSSLVKVLIIAMIVGFYKKTLSPSFDKETLLFSAIGIVLIAIAFCVTEISAHYHHKSKVGENNSKEDKRKQGEMKKE